MVERRSSGVLSTQLTNDGPVYHALSVRLSRSKLITGVNDRYDVAKFSKSRVWSKVPEGSTIVFECYSNHIATWISIQTAGLAFGSTGLCSYRVRGVAGSCAKHLTVESYTGGYKIRSCLSPLESTSQIASWSVHPFPHSSRSTSNRQTHKHTAWRSMLAAWRSG